MGGWDPISVEDEGEDGLGGVIRCELSPDLIAYRPEAFRFMRLSRILGAAKAIAEAELGTSTGEELATSIVSIGDYKGDFFVVWKIGVSRALYEPIIDRALHLENETEILHSWDGEQP